MYPDGYEDAESGWPSILKRFAAEAWRRAEVKIHRGSVGEVEFKNAVGLMDGIMGLNSIGLVVGTNCECAESTAIMTLVKTIIVRKIRFSTLPSTNKLHGTGGRFKIVVFIST